MEDNYTLWDLTSEVADNSKKILMDYNDILMLVNEFLAGDITKKDLRTFFINKNRAFINDLRKTKTILDSIDTRLQLIKTLEDS